MVGKELKTKRTLVGLTQKMLADRVGLSKQEISNIELDKIKPRKAIERVIDYEIGRAFVEWKIT